MPPPAISGQVRVAFQGQIYRRVSSSGHLRPHNQASPPSPSKLLFFVYQGKAADFYQKGGNLLAACADIISVRALLRDSKQSCPANRLDSKSVPNTPQARLMKYRPAAGLVCLYHKNVSPQFWIMHITPYVHYMFGA